MFGRSMKRSGSRKRRGFEMIEFAMCTPMLIAMCFGIIEMGRAFQVAQILTAAAREGARLGMLYNVVKPKDLAADPPIDTANKKVEQDIKNFLQASGINATPTIDITFAEYTPVNPGDPAPPADLDKYNLINGKYFKVRVQIPFDSVAYIPPFYLKGANLSGEVVFRHE